MAAAQFHPAIRFSTMQSLEPDIFNERLQIDLTEAFLSDVKCLESACYFHFRSLYRTLQNAPEYSIGTARRRPLPPVWERIQSLIQRFQNADRIVVGTPMWNFGLFGLPYKLKQLIDLVAPRNYLFA
jgi:hypothetical protein